MANSYVSPEVIFGHFAKYEFRSVIKAATQYLKIDKKNAAVLNCLANAYIALGEWNGAIYPLSLLCARHDVIGCYVEMLAFTMINSGRTEDAFKMLNEIPQQMANWNARRLVEAWGHLAAGKYTEATFACYQIGETDGISFIKTITKARVAFAEGRRDVANTNFKKALVELQTSPIFDVILFVPTNMFLISMCYEGLGDLHEATGNHREASAFYKQANKVRDPNYKLKEKNEAESPSALSTNSN